MLAEQNMFTSLYTLSTTNWVKIWFSTDPSQFIAKKYQAVENEMTELVIYNEEKQFTIVYSSVILDEQGKSAVHRIQEQFQTMGCHNITFLDIDSFEFQEGLANDRERALYGIALKELANLGCGGNPAAASDIIRILTPCTCKGIYTDFDVPLISKKIPPTITIKSPILFPVSGGKFCNDVVAVVPGVSSEFLDKIQQNILNGYSAMGLTRIAVSDKLGSPEDCSRLAIRIEELKSKYLSAVPPEDAIFELRQFIQLEIDECLKSNNESSLNFWRSAYMQSVMSITGPKNYEMVCRGLPVRHNNFCMTPLAELVTSQVTSHSNDASWVPSPPSAMKKVNEESSVTVSVLEEMYSQFKENVVDVESTTTTLPDTSTLRPQ